MATYRTFVFPSLHNKRGMDIVAREVVNFFRNLFPNNFFKYIYVDTSTNAPNMFMTENNDGSGEIVKEGVQKVAYPRLIVRVRPKENNVEDTTYEKLISIYKYPISQMVRTDFTMTCLFFDGDPYHIQLATMDDYSRSEIEFQISVQSKDDQEAVSNILSVCSAYGRQGRRSLLLSCLFLLHLIPAFPQILDHFVLIHRVEQVACPAVVHYLVVAVVAEDAVVFVAADPHVNLEAPVSVGINFHLVCCYF